MATPTPRQRGSVRPSFGTSSPNVQRNAAAPANRRTSYNPMASQAPQTPAGRTIDPELALGDVVDVPGEMYGTVKFLGNVKGKQGTFVGVELSREFASRGKNDGDVEGTFYFNTSIPGAGIFLPVHRAEKRASPALSLQSFPPTPPTPSYSNLRAAASKPRTPPSSSAPTSTGPRFAQSVGPGAPAPGPQLKPKPRPSLARPESPVRRPPSLAPTPARNFSQSQRPGAAPPRAAASPAPRIGGTPRLSMSMSTRAPPPPRSPSRISHSRLGHRSESISEKTEPGQSFRQSTRSPSRLNSYGNDNEVQRLHAQLEERDIQLKEQAATLADMETSLKEIQSLMPTEGAKHGSSRGTSHDYAAEIAQLRQALEEKNDKLQELGGEFDAHRADFRSTIDTLELASTETERVYEAKVADLMLEIRELREVGNSREDVESFAEQLKSLEELVAELEEGLEDARRGEAEARGEVEFLRGEVERGRSELQREKERDVGAVQGTAGGRGSPGARDRLVEIRDDEIRGLKAIIHSLSSEAAANGHVGNGTSEHTAGHDGDDDAPWCEVCEAHGHDVLDCGSLGNGHGAQKEAVARKLQGLEITDNDLDDAEDQAYEEEHSATKALAAVPAADLWCALCEKDGHQAFDCPEEQY